MITIVEDFYSPEDLGIMSLYFMNTPFLESYHSKEWQVSNRLQAYPVHESAQIPKSDDPRSAYQIFKRTLEYKTNLKQINFCVNFHRISAGNIILYYFFIILILFSIILGATGSMASGGPKIYTNHPLGGEGCV